MLNKSWLMNGDCLEEMKKIPDCSVDAIICDPPYGTTSCKWDSIIPLDLMWDELKRIIKPNGAIVMTASQPFTSTLIASNIKNFKYCWVWNKKAAGNQGLAKYQPLKIHEDVVVFGGCYKPIMTKGRLRRKGGYQKGKAGSICTGMKGDLSPVMSNLYYPKSILDISNANRKGRHHPTQKPVALMEYLIKTYTNENETVLDFTMGSGTTGVAAVNLDRKFIGIELDDKYFSIAENRINEALAAKTVTAA